MSYLPLRVILSALGLVLIVVHLALPDLKVDGTILGLLAIVVLPWFAAILKSVELPGGVKLEFQELERWVAQITTPAEQQPPQGIAPLKPPTLVVFPSYDDPNLALVAMRVEIEKRVRALAAKRGFQSNLPLRRLIDQLRRAEVFTAGEAGGLDRVVEAGNKAAHGGKVDQEVSGYAQNWATDIVDFLERKLAE